MATHSELLNPPSDVQTAVAAVIHACEGWQPTQVENLPPSVPTTASQAVPRMSEAHVCGFIQHPDAQVWSAVNAVLIIEVILVAFVWAFRVHRLPGALWRLALRLFPKRQASR